MLNFRERSLYMHPKCHPRKASPDLYLVALTFFFPKKIPFPKHPPVRFILIDYLCPFIEV